MKTYKGKEYYSSTEVARMVDRTTNHVRYLLSPPDLVTLIRGNQKRNWYEKERVDRWAKEYAKVARKSRRKNKTGKYIPEHPLGDGRGVHTWCIKCGYPFTSQQGERICRWCEKGVSRDSLDTEVLIPKKLRSTPCPECGGPRFVGQILCSFCRKEKKRTFGSYDPWLEAGVAG